MKQKIAIWGTGKRAEKFLLSYGDIFDVQCFYDNVNYDRQKYGVIVKRYDPTDNIKIIIASTYWKEIAAQLEESGKRYLIDYIDSEAYENGIQYEEICKRKDDSSEIIKYSNWGGRKYAVISGNCQTSRYEDLLVRNQEFSREYIIVKVPKVCDWISKASLMEKWLKDDAFWKNVDLYIYQYVKEENRFSKLLFSDRTLGRLRQDCKKLRIVNTYFDGYWPQIRRLTIAERRCLSWDKSGLLGYSDKYIEKFMKQGLAFNEILDKIEKVDFLSEHEMKEAVQNSLAKIKDKEQDCDVKISDYIIDNYDKRQLFYAPNHPIEELLLVYLNRILKKLGYDPWNIDITDFNIYSQTLKGQDIPVYNSVINYLELDEYEKVYFPNRYVIPNCSLDRKGFFKLYFDLQRFE